VDRGREQDVERKHAMVEVDEGQRGEAEDPFEEDRGAP